MTGSVSSLSHSSLGFCPGMCSSPHEDMGFPGNSNCKESACDAGDLGSIPGWGRSPGEGHGNPLQYSCLGNPHGQRNLTGYSPWGHKELDTTERLTLTNPPLPLLGALTFVMASPLSGSQSTDSGRGCQALAHVHSFLCTTPWHPINSQAFGICLCHGAKVHLPLDHLCPRV